MQNVHSAPSGGMSKLDQLLIEDIDKSLSDFMQNRSLPENSIVAQAYSSIEKNRSEDTGRFIKEIVEKIVIGPAQEVFSGQEIIDAIKAKKVSSFTSAFVSLSERIVDIALTDAKEDSIFTYKDFRDIFVLSVLVSMVTSESRNKNLTEEVLRGFFVDGNFKDMSDKSFHSAMLECFYKTMGEEDSGSTALPFLFHSLFSTNETKDDHLKWARPAHIDYIFNC